MQYELHPKKYQETQEEHRENGEENKNDQNKDLLQKSEINFLQS